MQTVYVLIAVFGWGIWGLFNKMALQTLSPWQMQLMTILSGVAMAVPILLFAPRSEPTPWTWPISGVALALLAGFSSWMATLGYYFALRRNAVTEVIGLISLYPLVTVFLAFLVLREPFSWGKAVGVFLICSGLWFLGRH